MSQLSANAEARRLAALRRHEILDTAPEKAFDDVTRMAARIFGVPIVLVSLVDEARQWFKSKVGIDVGETPLGVSFCRHAIYSGEILEVADATLDERFRDNALVTGDPGIRFYAGAPLRTPDGFGLGTLCLIDRQPRTLTEGEREMLQLLAAQTTTLLELRRKAIVLERREQQLENAFEAAGLGVWDWTPEDGIVTWSPQAAALLGMPVAEASLSATELGRLFVEQDVAAVQADFQRCAAGESDHVRAELRGRRTDGEMRWFQVQGRVRPDTRGQRRRMTGVLRDITAKKASDEALRASERHFRSYFEMSLVGFARSSPDKGIVEVNDRFCQILGYSREELRRMSWAELTHPEDLGSDVALFEEVAAGQSDGYSLEKRYIRKDKVVVHATISVRCLRRPDGSPEAFLAMVEDISERKRAELALRENERRLSLVFNNVTDRLALMRVEPGPEFRVISVNAHCLESVSESDARLSAEDIVGRTVRELGERVFGLERSTGESLVGKFGEVVGSGSTLIFEEISHGPEGPVLGETVLTPVPAGDDPCAFILYSSRDITDRQRAKEQKEQLEAQLRQAQKMEAIGTLAGGIAHDFNNILAAILAYTDLAMMNQGDRQAQMEDLAQILKASDRAKHLVQQILSFSRQQKQERRPVRLDLVVNEVMRLLRSTLPTIIDLRVEVVTDSPVVLADPTQIHQVLMNLSTNAAHAMRGRAGRLEVRLDRITVSPETVPAVADLRPGPHARLTVSDTGHGMDDITLKRVFEPFFTTKAPGEGSGLGLSVVHGIVKDHEGTIHVRSRPGEGTVFELYLPEHTAAASEEPRPGQGLPSGNGEHILVIDDESAVLDAVGRALRRLGFVATLADSPDKALELFHAAPMSFDAVVTDLTMPSMTGPDLALRLLEIRPGTPIILATGFSGTWTRATAREFGFREMLFKPVSIATLGETLRSALGPDVPPARQQPVFPSGS